MKKNYSFGIKKAYFKFLSILFISIFTSQRINSQIINETFEENEWKSFTSGTGNSGSTNGKVVLTATSASSTVTYFTVQNSSLTSTSTNTSPNSGTWWYSKVCTYSGTKMDKLRSKSYSVQLSSSGYIVTPITKGAFVSVTFWAALPNPVVVGINTNTNANQGTYSSGNMAPGAGFDFATQSFSSGTNSYMTSYSFTGTFSGPARIGFFNPQGSSIYIDDIVVTGPTGTAPVVTTNSVTPGQNTALVNCTLTAGLPAPSMPLLSYGMIWSTSNTGMDTTLTSKTRVVPPTISTFPGAYSQTATSLIPNGTQYYARAYAVALDGNIYYGAIIPFTTLAATVPTLSTTAATNILSFKATSGGNTIDSGGVKITQKGVCWSTSPNPTVALLTRTLEGQYGNNFSSLITGLQPNTTYYVRAYAQNSVGTGYGNEISFTTSAAVPVLTATPLALNFGNVSFNANSPILSYLLSGNYLSPTTGSVTVSAPNGYDISTSSNSGFGATTTVTYTGGLFTNKRIYVKLKTNNYGTFNGAITHSGGGTLPANTDTVNVSGNIIQDPTLLTNSGTDFWLGFGYQEKMSQTPGNSSEAKMTVYIATGDAAANVTVSIPGIPGWIPQNISIAANSIGSVTNFPISSINSEDSRLYYTGISNKAVHVTSNNGSPIAVWVYIAANNNSAGGSMIFPTNTWNSSYVVQAYGGKSNVGGVPNSYFFVIANEDNTPVTFTPSNDIVDSSAATIFKDGHTPANVKYQKNTSYTVVLNKGQVFNAMGYVNGSNSNNAEGLDLSGTTVSTTCDKKITVFGGNGRCLVKTPTSCTAPTSGSDNLIQQMVPSIAWGTKYYTVPTKHMENNLFRVYIKDAGTVVKLNGSILPATSPTFVNNLYYEFESNQPSLIEADKPITVTQFLTSCSSSGSASSLGNNGYGDPEMIILSAAQQSITKATVYNPTFANGQPGAGYINVVIPTIGISSFKIDSATNTTQMVDTGRSSYLSGNALQSATLIPIASAFKPFAADPNYSWAKFKVSYPGAHTISSTIPFNAIAYGVNNDGESYGFNAGTTIKNLTAVNIAQNPFGTDSSTTSIKTCVNNPVTLQIALPYLPYKVDSVLWNPGTPLVSPQGSITGPRVANTSNPSGFAAQYTNTIVVDGQTFYIYKCPIPYTFSQEGSYQMYATAYGTFISDCGDSARKTINIVVGHDDISFTATPGACGSTAVTFADNTQPLAGTTIQQYQWTFGDGNSYTANAPNILPTPNPHIYPSTSSGVTSYWAKLKTINSVGCYSEDSVYIDLSFNLKAGFLASKDTICAGSSVSFTDLSTSNAIAWYWDWADGKKDTVLGTAPAAPISHTFTSAGTFNVKLFVKNAAGCISAIKDTNIVVIANPVVDFQTPPGICLGGSMQFTNLTTPTTGVSYLWNFGDAGATISNPNTSTLKDPTHIYNSSGPFIVTLTATLNQYNCVASTNKTLSSTIYQLPTAAITSPTAACMKDTIQFSSASSIGGSGNTITNWYWDFGDGNTSTLQNPKHAYLTTGSKIVTLYIKSDKGCVSTTTTQTVTINPVPNVTYIAIPSVCANATAFTINNFSETTGLTGVWSYSGTGVSGNSFNPATSGVGTFQIIATFTASNTCKDSDTTTITVNPLPTVDFTTSTVTCEKSAITFTDASTANGGSTSGWIWDFGDLSATGSNASTTHTYANPNSYNVTLTVKNGNNCVASKTKPVVVHSQPFANFALPTAVCLPIGFASFTNQSSVADDANPSYTWDFGDPNNSTGSTLPNPTHNYSSTGPFNIKLTVKSQYQCSKDTIKTLSSVYTEPQADFIALPDEVCLGDTIVFNNTSTGNGVTWRWNFGDGNTDTLKNSGHTYTDSGSFVVSHYYVDIHGCTSITKQDTVTIHPYPTVDAGPTVWALQGSPITINATAKGTLMTYLWDPATYLNYDTVLRPTVTPLTDNNLYTLYVTGNGGCIASDTVRVMLLRTPIIPNVFSPNGDGKNDRWEIQYLNNFEGCTVEVFDRNGHVIFSKRGYATAWDGTSNGKPVPVGVYYYIIEPKHGHPVMSGSVTILR